MARVPVETKAHGQAPGHGKKRGRRPGKRGGEKRTLMDPPAAYGGARPSNKVPAKLDAAEYEAVLREVAELVAKGFAHGEVPALFQGARKARNQRLREAGLPEQAVPGHAVIERAIVDAEEKILGLAREPRDRVAGRQLLQLELLRSKAEQAGKLNAAVQAVATAARIKGTFAPIRVAVSVGEREQQALQRVFSGMSREQLLALARGERPALGGTKAIDVEGEPVDGD